MTAGCINSKRPWQLCQTLAMLLHCILQMLQTWSQQPCAHATPALRCGSCSGSLNPVRVAVCPWELEGSACARVQSGAEFPRRLYSGTTRDRSLIRLSEAVSIAVRVGAKLRFARHNERTIEASCNYSDARSSGSSSSANKRALTAALLARAPATASPESRPLTANPTLSPLLN